MNAQAPIKLPTIKLNVSNPVLMTAADLPAHIGRWTPVKKMMVVEAVAHGLITREAALQRYDIGADEFAVWWKRYDGFGRKGLKARFLDLVPKPAKRRPPSAEVLTLEEKVERLTEEVARLRRRGPRGRR
jgi:Protein of unknown function (DUF1153)